MADRGETYRSVWRDLMKLPFEQGYVDAAGLRTRYLHAGRKGAPAVIMLHGTGGHWEAFSPNIGPFAEHFDVYAMDMLGCGFTDKPDRPYEMPEYIAQVIAFMDAMGLKSASLMGVSLGAWVAIRVAHAHPDRIDRVVLVAPSGLLPMPAAAAAGTTSRSSLADDASWDRVAENMKGLYYDPATLTDDIVAVRQAIYKTPGIKQIMPRMMTMMNPEARARNNLTEDQWRSIKTPVLVIAHVDSPDMHLDTAKKIVHLLPNVQNVDMKEISHWAQFEKPQAFNALAIPFLKGEKVAA